MKRFIFLIISVFMISGCSYAELNDLAVVSALGIDYKDNSFYLTAQVMDIKNSNDGATDANTLIYESNGETIAKAIRNFSVRYPKNVYLGHLEFLILSKDTSKKINDVFDFVMRSPEVRSSTYVLFSEEETAKEVMNPDNEVEDRFPVESLKTVLLDSKKRNGIIYDLSLEKFLSTYLKKGIDPLVPLVKCTNEKGMKATSVIIDNLAVFKNKKLLGPLDSNESIAYNTINNNYNDIVINGKYKDVTFESVIYNPKSKINLDIKDNKVYVDINVNIESKMIEISKKIDLTDPKVQGSIKSVLNNEIKGYVRDLLDYSRDYNVDVLGLKNMLYKDYYKDYSKYKNSNLYEVASFNININNKMYRFGNINKGA